jgi:Zn-dependent protease
VFLIGFGLNAFGNLFLMLPSLPEIMDGYQNVHKVSGEN